jgi:hypothetical protein
MSLDTDQVEPNDFTNDVTSDDVKVHQDDVESDTDLNKIEANPLLISKPKKPLSAWLIFSIEGRRRISLDFQERGESISMVEITKLLGEEYRNLNDEAKARYEALAQEDKVRYTNDMAVWSIQQAAQADTTNIDHGIQNNVDDEGLLTFPLVSVLAIFACHIYCY